MDEKKLTELFKDAVREAPPASFGTGDVQRASRRATERRRTAIVSGSVLAVVLLGGGAVTGVALSGETLDSNASAPMVASSGQGGGGGTMYDNGAASGPSARAESGQPNDRSEGPKQGGPPVGSAGPSAGSTPGGCEKADRELAAALASELPAAANARVGEEKPVPFACPPGSRAASFNVVDGPRAGTLSVVLAPPGSTPGIAPMGASVPGTVNQNAPALLSGGMVYIVSQPGPELAEPPFGEIAQALAAGIAQNH